MAKSTAKRKSPSFVNKNSLFLDEWAAGSEILTAKEAGLYLGVAHTSVSRIARSGDVPSVMPFTVRYFRKDDLTAYMRKAVFGEEAIAAE